MRLIIDALEVFAGLRDTVSVQENDCSRRAICTGCQAAIERLTQHAFPSFNISPSSAKRCFVLPPVDEATVEHVTPLSICDYGVYTKNRNFRIAGSRKLSGSGILWPVGIHEPTSLVNIWPTYFSFAQTLVTFFSSE